MNFLDEETAAVRSRVHSLSREIRSQLDSLDSLIINGRTLNPLGVLQQLGPQLDAAVAVLATLLRLKKVSLSAAQLHELLKD
jgi:hypothetical protein